MTLSIGIQCARRKTRAKTPQPLRTGYPLVLGRQMRAAVVP
jgi:hypothetical protein